MRSIWSKMIGLSLALSMAAGCQTGQKSAESADPKPNAGANAEISKEPVELTFFSVNEITDEEFALYADSVKAKHPNITLRWLKNSAEITMPKLVTSGVYPDLVVSSLQFMPTNIQTFGLELDLTELIAKNQFNVNRLDQTFIRAMKAAAGGKLLGLPISNGGGNVMFYNKNLFDKFGVPYPKDGLTWDDAYELSKKMTRADQGIQYRGVGMAHSFLLTVNSMSLPNVDPKTNKSVVNSEGWKKLFENYSRFYSINGNGVTESNSTDASDEAAFAKEQRLAAFIWGVYRFKMFPAELNWDMVSVPTMKEAPGLNPQGNPRFLFITSQTKHKDQAFQALSQLLSDEVQLEFSRRGIGSSLNSEPIKAVYGQSLPVFKGKNIKALYHNKQAELSPASSGPINKAVDNEFRKVIEGKKDINTALRDADESVNKLILMEQQK